MGSGCIFLPENYLGLSLGHLVINPSSPGPPASDLACSAVVEATADALCGRGARTASRAQSGLDADRWAHPGGALQMRPRRHRSSLATPLAIKRRTHPVSRASFPSGSGGGEGKADTLSEEGTSSAGRRRPGQASGTERVCPPGLRASLRAPWVSGRLPLVIARVLGSLLSGRLETLDNGAEQGGWPRAEHRARGWLLPPPAPAVPRLEPACQPARGTEPSSGAALLLVSARLGRPRKATGGRAGGCPPREAVLGGEPSAALGSLVRAETELLRGTSTMRSLLTPRGCFGPRAIYLCQHPFKLVLFSIPL